MHRYSTARLLCLLLFAALLLTSMPPAGLSAADRPVASDGPARSGTVRPDGRLDFLRPDGSVLASIVIEIAETAEAKMTGLMGRPTLGVTEGMLFIYDGEAMRYFWMKNTLISLDIIFVDARKRIVHIAESTAPMSEQFYSSGSPARYVVEVPAGFVKLFGIGTGTRIRWRTR